MLRSELAIGRPLSAELLADGLARWLEQFVLLIHQVGQAPFASGREPGCPRMGVLITVEGLTDAYGRGVRRKLLDRRQP